MAKQRGSAPRDRRRGRPKGAPGGGRRKACPFCRDKVDRVDYKDLGALRRAVSDKGKIRSSRVTGACRRHQSQLAIAVKRARRSGSSPTSASDDPGKPLMAQAILLKDVDTLGERGAVIDVSPGYLRNFLVPRKLAQPATPAAIAESRRREEAAERAAAAAAAQAQETATLLRKTVLTISHQAGDDGRLFGSVTAQEIVDAIRQARGVRLEKRRVQLAEPIRTTGTHMVGVEVADGVTTEIKTVSPRRHDRLRSAALAVSEHRGRRVPSAMAVAVPPDSTGSVPPHNEEAEASVLGAVLLTEQALDGVLLEVGLRAEHFYRPRHQLIFRSMVRLKEKAEPEAVDALTVCDDMRRAGELEEAGGEAYVHSLPTVVPAVGAVMHYARIVRDDALLRSLLGTTREIQAEVLAHRGQPRDLIERAEQALFRIGHDGASAEMRSLEAVLHEEIDKLEELSRKDIGLTGTPSGFADLDALTGGFQPGNLIVVAARPAMGKCLAGSSLIYDPRTGTRRPIRECIERFEQGEEIAVASLGRDLRLRSRAGHGGGSKRPETRLSTDDRARPASRGHSESSVPHARGVALPGGAWPGAKIAVPQLPRGHCRQELPADEFVLPAALIFDGSNGVSPPASTPLATSVLAPSDLTSSDVATSVVASSDVATSDLPHLGRVVGRSRRHRAARRAGDLRPDGPRGPQLRSGRHHRPQQHAGHQHR